MKKYLLITLLLIIKLCFADGTQDHIVLKENGINLMEKPDVNSKILKHLPFGSIIKCRAYLGTYNDKSCIPGIVEGVDGYWIESHHENLDGYVFSPYVYFLFEWYKVDTVINENTIRITSEGYDLRNINYNPNLHWYGLYQDSIGFYLKKVDVKIVHSHIVGAERFHKYSCMDWEGILLETNMEKESIFLIGVGKEWKEGRMYEPETFFNKYVENETDDGFLYPEKEIRMWYGSSYNIFKAYDSLIIDPQCNVNKMYQLEFIRSDHGSTVKVNLNKDLDINGPGKYYSESRSPQIYWVGDINQDGYLDFITFQFGFNNKGPGTIYSLFMYNAYSEDNPLYKASSTITWSCY